MKEEYDKEYQKAVDISLQYQSETEEADDLER